MYCMGDTKFTAHRLGHVTRPRRRKANQHSAVSSIVHISKADKKQKKKPKSYKSFDHSPHEVYCQAHSR